MFVKRMIRDVGVAAVPGSSFYQPRDLGQTKFAKKDETLREAGQRLAQLSPRRPE